MITPDLKQNIFYMMKFLIQHNFLALIYAIGIFGGIILSILKPSRKTIVLMLGFIVLLFSFEYNKHIVDSLREQTINSLITVQEHNTVRRIINILTLKLIPLGTPLLGWAMVFVPSYLHGKDLLTKKQKKK